MADMIKPKSVVALFYEALTNQDTSTVEVLIGQHFLSNVELLLPPGLPYGGAVSGIRSVKSVFLTAATGPRLGPEHIRIDSLAAGESTVFAELTFNWAGAPNDCPSSRAIETWLFEGAGVRRITAYYWDPAACPRPPRARP